MRIVSFYSDPDGSTYYSKHARRFREDADILKLPVTVKKMQNQGDYRKNCLRKPEFLKTMMQQMDGPILWVDIDSKIHKNDFGVFEQFESSVEFAAVAPPQAAAWWGIRASPLYLNNTDNTMHFLDEWIRRCRKALQDGEQVFDHEVLFTMEKWIKVQNMSYKIIIDPRYITWPGESNENTIIEIGMSDNEQKRETLKQLGVPDWKIDWQCRGDTFEDEVTNAETRNS